MQSQPTRSSEMSKADTCTLQVVRSKNEGGHAGETAVQQKEANAISAYSVFRDVLSFLAGSLRCRHLHLSDFKT